MVKEVALALTLLGADPSPCAGPASEACERALVDAALMWEKKWLSERQDHLATMEACTAALQTTPEPAGTHPLTWALVGLGGVIIGVLSVLAINSM